MSADAILRPGETCWALERADRLAWLVDGEAYFSAVAEALESARRQVLILGWDVHSGVRLEPGEDHESGETLRHRLNRLAGSRPDLQVQILSWDFAMIYALEREPLPTLQLGWRTHRRVRIRLDSSHPVGASHHQKIVVVDDALAFVGGLDLTMRRWDRPSHRFDDGQRRDPSGKPYGPFHDVQALVSGPAAARLGELARTRWWWATGESLEAPDIGEAPAWPSRAGVDLEGIDLALARTFPAHDGRPACREVEALHLAAIRQARRHIYIENQYFTSHRIGEALAERLRDPDGPEIVFVGPRHQLGWLERSVMGQLRARLMERLRQADRHGRLLATYPELPGGDREHVLNVHAKVMAVDDDFLTMGTANLSNRSMGLDSECNIALEGGRGDGAPEGITALRDRLLAEHLGCAAGDVRRALSEAGGSLQAAVRSLQGGGRTLAPLPQEDPEAWDVPGPALNAADPERPVASKDLEALLGERIAGGEGAPWWRGLLAAALAAAVAGFWLWGPLPSMDDAEAWTSLWRAVEGGSLFPVWIVATYVVGSLLLVPLNILVLATGAVLEPAAAFVTAMAGAMAGGAATFAVGRGLGRQRVRRLLGRRADAVERRLGAHGTWMVAALRLLPVAPYGLVNAAAGAAGLPWRPFLLGSLIGLSPGLLAVTVLGDRLRALVSRPGPGTAAGLAAVLLAAGAALFLIRRHLQRRLERGRGKGKGSGEKGS